MLCPSVDSVPVGSKFIMNNVVIIIGQHRWRDRALIPLPRMKVASDQVLIVYL
jgi:hypothetical protein